MKKYLTYKSMISDLLVGTVRAAPINDASVAAAELIDIDPWRS